jgi:hypothetical protein
MVAFRAADYVLVPIKSTLTLLISKLNIQPQLYIKGQSTQQRFETQ